MSGNGELKPARLIVKVELTREGKMEVTFGDFNMALLSHGIRMASLTLDNEIMKPKEPSKIVPINQIIPNDVIKRFL